MSPPPQAPIALRPPRTGTEYGLPRWLQRWLKQLGATSLLAGRAFARAFKPPLRLHAIAEQIHVIGVRSISIVLLTAVFSSMVMTVQFALQLARFGAKEWVGNVVGVSPTSRAACASASGWRAR